MTKILAALLVALIMVTGCGYPVCVAGIGDCGEPSLQPQSSSGLMGASAPTAARTPVLGCESWGHCWVERGKRLKLVPVGGSGTYEITLISGRDIGKIETQGTEWFFVPSDSASTGSRARLRLTANKSSGWLSEVDVTVVGTLDY